MNGKYYTYYKVYHTVTEDDMMLDNREIKLDVETRCEYRYSVPITVGSIETEAVEKAEASHSVLVYDGESKQIIATYIVYDPEGNVVKTEVTQHAIGDGINFSNKLEVDGSTYDDTRNFGGKDCGFSGWSLSYDKNDKTLGDLVGNSYTLNENTTFYAVYVPPKSESESKPESETKPEPECYDVNCVLL